jgi:hypothetical protein
MKFCFLLVILLIAGKTVFAQSVPSTCIPSAQLRYSYNNDVADLALQRLYETNSPDTALIEIPQRYQDTIWQALAAVANTGALFEADSIFQNYCVHRWPHKAYKGNSVDVKVDTSYAWAKQWYLGSALIGNSAIDSFMARHGVYLQSYMRNTGSQHLNDIATLGTTRAINLSAFMDSVIQFAGVTSFYPRGFPGDAGNMYYRYDTAAHLTFVAAWGDCPSGCMDWKEWTYTVSLANCRVALDTVSENTHYPNIPPYHYNCNGNPIRIVSLPLAGTFSLTLFPNPATTMLQVRGASGGPFTYRISDISGRRALAGTCTNNTLEIATLPVGFYMLTIWEREGRVYNQRFVKN